MPLYRDSCIIQQISPRHFTQIADKIFLAQDNGTFKRYYRNFLCSFRPKVSEFPALSIGFLQFLVKTPTLQKQRGSRAALFSLSKNLFQREVFPKQQGELEGAKPASNEIECLQKACASRRLRRTAADFLAAERPENRDIVKAPKKSVGLFRQPERSGNAPAYFARFWRG